MVISNQNLLGIDSNLLSFEVANNDKNCMVVDANIENVNIVTDFVDEVLDQNDCSMKAKIQIDVALDEIFSNICHYAYKEGECKKAKIITNVVENKVEIIFMDKGEPYNPLEKEDPNNKASLDERQIGGLGIFIVKNTMDSMEYELIDGFNVLKITKTIK